MTLLLPLFIALLLVALPRLLPLPVVSTASVPAGATAATWHACELPEPPSLPKPQASTAPNNLLYLPLGLHPADRCLHGPLVVEGLVRIRPPLQFWRICAGEPRAPEWDIIHTELVGLPASCFEISFIIAAATSSVQRDQASTTLL